MTLNGKIPYCLADGPSNFLVPSRAMLPNGLPNSTSTTFHGDGDWQVRKHGVQQRRQSLLGRVLRKNRVRGARVASRDRRRQRGYSVRRVHPSREGYSPVSRPNPQSGWVLRAVML
jgi:hypothetical protein